MSIAIGLIGISLFRIGMWTSIDSNGAVEVCSPGLAGCGMAAFLGVAASWVL